MMGKQLLYERWQEQNGEICTAGKSKAIQCPGCGNVYRNIKMHKCKGTDPAPASKRHGSIPTHRPSWGMSMRTGNSPVTPAKQPASSITPSVSTPVCPTGSPSPVTPSSTCIPDTSLVSGSSSPSSVCRPQLCRTLFTSTPDKATSDGETEVEGEGGEEDEEEEEPPLLKGTISSCPQCSKPVTMDPTVECLLCDGCNTWWHLLCTGKKRLPPPHAQFYCKTCLLSMES